MDELKNESRKLWIAIEQISHGEVKGCLLHPYLEQRISFKDLPMCFLKIKQFMDGDYQELDRGASAYYLQYMDKIKTRKKVFCVTIHVWNNCDGQGMVAMLDGSRQTSFRNIIELENWICSEIGLCQFDMSFIP